MKVPFFDLKKQYLNIKPEIDAAISNVINSSQFIYGPWLDEFEKSFAKKLEMKHCIGVGNGTDALIIILKMLGIKAGDEVITSANTFIATSESIVAVGAKPVFVDINSYFNIDISKIESYITSKTKAIIAVHLYGQPSNIEAISDICKKNNLLLIEDCAQAHFASINGKHCGTFGNAATFSFYPSKNLGAFGDGGCIVTNSDDLNNKIRCFTNHGSKEKYIHINDGINSRLDGMQAAILLAKLKYIDTWNEMRIKAAEYYLDLLSDIKGVEVPKIMQGANHIFHLFVIKAKTRDELQKHLTAAGIGTGLHYPIALPFMPCYSKYNYKKEDFPNAYSDQFNILSLPMYPEIERNEIEYVAQAIRNFYNQ